MSEDYENVGDDDEEDNEDYEDHDTMMKKTIKMK